jgi:hypothetical protein
VALAAADRAMYRQKREHATAQQDWAGQKKLGDDVG